MIVIARCAYHNEVVDRASVDDGTRQIQEHGGCAALNQLEVIGARWELDVLSRLRKVHVFDQREIDARGDDVDRGRRGGRVDEASPRNALSQRRDIDELRLNEIVTEDQLIVVS